MRRQILEAVAVEGIYDKNALAQIVDTVIVTLDGFGVYSEGEKLTFLRRLAERRGLIVMTDSDGAGFQIRNYLKGALPRDRVKHAYIPDVYGKERRKQRPGREGKLGVEGMPPHVLLESLRRCGATFLDEAETAEEERGGLTKADLYALGLTGGRDSAQRRTSLLRRLDLPERLTANGLLEALNVLYGRDAFLNMMAEKTAET